MATMTETVKKMARKAKRDGYSRDKAHRCAPTKPHLHDVFMTEFDRFNPRKGARHAI